jgi:hypothetical protein
MDNTEHSFTFNAQIETNVYATVTEAEYEDFSEDGESIEEYARRKAKDKAPLDLTRKIADDGVRESSINIGELENHDEY